MTSLKEQLPIACPYHFSRAYLEEAVKPLADSGAQRVVPLTVPLGDRSIGKEAIVQFSAASDPRHFDQPWAIHWEPKDGGPYPDFDGMLTVRADETYDSSVLELAGEYKPPLGAAGAVFDAVLGKRIAEITTQGLLERIGSAMVARYQAEESQKDPGSQPKS